MSNLTDALIAAKLMGNGGGGGGGGLPPIEPAMVDIIPSQTIPFYDDGGQYMAEVSVDVPVLSGVQITTVWDGVEYTNTTVQFQPTMIVWGNLSPLGGPDTGEPFLGIYYTDQPGIMLAALTSQAASHVISVASVSQNIPDGSMLVVDNGEWTTNTKKQIFGETIHIPVTFDLSNHAVTFDGYTADEVAQMRQVNNASIVLDNPSVALSYPVPYDNTAIGFNFADAGSSATLYIYVVSYDQVFKWELTS